MPPVKKGEKITDPVVLERLAKAREKALETRRANAQAKKDAKLVEQLDKKKAQLLVQDRLSAMNQVQDPPPRKDLQGKDEDGPEAEEAEVQVEYLKMPKKPKKKKPVKKVVFVESSESSASSAEEEEIVYKRRPKTAPSSRAPKQPEPPQRARSAADEQSDMIDRLYQRYYGNR